MDKKINNDFVQIFFNGALMKRATQEAVSPMQYDKGVYDNFLIMKAGIMNLMSVEKWEWKQYDHVSNEFAVSPEYWTTAQFTLFVYL